MFRLYEINLGSRPAAPQASQIDIVTAGGSSSSALRSGDTSRDQSFIGAEVVEARPIKRRRSTDISQVNSANSSASKTEAMPGASAGAGVDDGSQSAGDDLPELPISEKPAYRNGDTYGQPPREDVLDDPLAWDVDPCAIAPDEALRLLEKLLLDQPAPFIFPVPNFLRWTQECKTKSRDERTLLWSLLACSSLGPDTQSAFSKGCIDRALRAINAQSNKTNLLLIQSRIFVSFYYYLEGQETSGSQLISASCRAIGTAGMHTEAGCAMPEELLDRNYFDMNAAQLIECKRRTFWYFFMLDVSTAFHTHP